MSDRQPQFRSFLPNPQAPVPRSLTGSTAPRPNPAARLRRPSRPRLYGRPPQLQPPAPWAQHERHSALPYPTRACSPSAPNHRHKTHKTRWRNPRWRPPSRAQRLPRSAGRRRRDSRCPVLKQHRSGSELSLFPTFPPSAHNPASLLASPALTHSFCGLRRAAQLQDCAQGRLDGGSFRRRAVNHRRDDPGRPLVFRDAEDAARRLRARGSGRRERRRRPGGRRGGRGCAVGAACPGGGRDGRGHQGGAAGCRASWRRRAR